MERRRYAGPERHPGSAHRCAHPPSFDALIDGLGLRERTILAFRLVEEHDYPTIAGIMGMSESAVKMAYRRAIERLRLRHPHLR